MPNELLILPLATGDEVEVLEGLSGWDDLEEADVVVVSSAAVEEECEADATGEGAPAPKKKKKKNKAELRDQLGKNDPYSLLELDDLRWRATADDIRKSYRRLVLQHHPDKQNSGKPAEEAAEEGDKAPRASEASEGGGEEGDEMFKAITDAFELLSNPKKRRDFDSLDEFDDSIPSFDPAHDDFLQVFAPVFERNSRWSEVQPAPLLGEADAPFEEVAVFYNFWFGFKSWRDFADADEYNPDEAGFREEKRWMERENEKLRKVQRKKEDRRIEKLVERAYENDPRVKRHAQEEKEGKARAKAERQAKQAAARAEEQQRRKDEAAAEQAAREAEEARLKAEAAERKRQKEKEAKALRKQRARLRSLSKEAALVAEEECEALCAALSMARLDELCAGLEALLPADTEGAREALRAEGRALEQQQAAEAAIAAVEAEQAAEAAQLAAEEGARPDWSEHELKLLYKGTNQIPGGVPDRWGRIAEFINHQAKPCHERTADEVIKKTKDLRKGIDSKRKQAPAPAPAPAPARAQAPTPAPAPVPAPAHATATPPTPASAAPSAAAAAAAATAAATAAAAGEWSAEQQKALEKSLAQFPASLGPDRWDKIAEVVPGKLRVECIARYKQVVAALKAKKAATAGAK